jgi:hypothetical protein
MIKIPQVVGVDAKKLINQVKSKIWQRVEPE